MGKESHSASKEELQDSEEESQDSEVRVQDVKAPEGEENLPKVKILILPNGVACSLIAVDQASSEAVDAVQKTWTSQL